MLARLCLLLLLLSLLSPAVAVDDETDPYDAFRNKSDYNEDLEVPWVELETDVKALPQEENLVEIPLDTLPPGMTLFADLENLKVDERDLVTRTWLVVRSNQGVDNATYEGIRCATHEYKVYAYANPQRSRPLRVVKFPRWRIIRDNGYRKELADDSFCDGSRPLKRHQIRSHPASEATDYDSPY